MTKQVAQQLESVFQGQGREVIGALVYWSLAGVHWERDAMRAELDTLGLGAAMGRDPRPEAILSEAVDVVKAGLKGCFFRRVGRYDHALVEEATVGNGEGVELAHQHVITLRVVPGKDGAPTKVEAAQVPEALASDHTKGVAQRVLDAYADRERFAGTSTLSSVLVTALHGTLRDHMLAGISLRETTGGVYFVPAAQVSRVKALSEVVGKATKSTITVLTLYGDADNLAAAAAAAKSGFMAQLNELRAELQAFVADRKATGAEMTDRHADTRVARLMSLESKVALWDTVLGDVASDLRSHIKAAKEEVAKEMGLA